MLGFMFNTKNRNKAILVLIAAAMLAISSPVLADEARTPEQVRQEFETTFQLMFADPSDVNTTMHYAELAVELKDYEAAIPPLERLLMYNPDLTQVRLQVGILYYLLNSHAVAKKYLHEVAEDAHATPELVSRANQYLAKM